MATILVAMAGYALLFSSLRLLGASPRLIAAGGALIALVALAQVIAIRWGVPRAASIIAGVVFWIAVVVWLAVADGAPVHAVAVAVAMIVVILLGPLSGYVAGVLVGSVFLIAHHLRESRALRRRAAPPPAAEFD